MTKEILDDDLINFSVNAKANYRTYLKSYNDGTEIVLRMYVNQS